jgi:hypothetical protein
MKQTIHLCTIDAENIVHDTGKTIKRVVRERDFLLLSDGLKVGRVMYKGVEHEVCKPLDEVAGWQLIVGKTEPKPTVEIDTPAVKISDESMDTISWAVHQLRHVEQRPVTVESVYRILFFENLVYGKDTISSTLVQMGYTCEDRAVTATSKKQEMSVNSLQTDEAQR